MKNRRGTDGFALQARHVAFNKLMGLSTDEAYAAPPTPKGKNGNNAAKRDLGKIKAPTVLSAEGRKIDLTRFNG